MRRHTITSWAAVAVVALWMVACGALAAPARRNTKPVSVAVGPHLARGPPPSHRRVYNRPPSTPPPRRRLLQRCRWHGRSLVLRMVPAHRHVAPQDGSFLDGVAIAGPASQVQDLGSTMWTQAVGACGSCHDGCGRRRAPRAAASPTHLRMPRPAPPRPTHSQPCTAGEPRSPRMPACGRGQAPAPAIAAPTCHRGCPLTMPWRRHCVPTICGR